MSTIQHVDDAAYAVMTKAELIAECRARKLTFSGKKKNDPGVSNTEPLSRTKATNGSNETADIAKLIRDINERTPVGEKLRATYSARFPGYENRSAKVRLGGNRRTHYDFLIEVAPLGSEVSEWLTVEHKSSCVLATIDEALPITNVGVQFYNGPGGKFTLANVYMRCWYDAAIASGYLASQFGIAASIPSYEDSISEMTRQSGEPKTLFFRALKTACKGQRLLELRSAVIAAFIEKLKTDPSVQEVHAKEVHALANEALAAKDRCLVICGSLESPDAFNCAWLPGVRLPPLETMRTELLEDELDIKFRHTFVGSSIKFLSHLRWGKGQGFNLRCDFKVC